MDRIGFALYRFVGIVVGMLSLKAGFCLGAAFGWLGYFVAWPYRRLVLRNLAIAFGREKLPSELRALARKHFALLGANLFSALKLPRLSREELERVVIIEGLETIDAGIVANGGFVMVISHLEMGAVRAASPSFSAARSAPSSRRSGIRHRRRGPPRPQRLGVEFSSERKAW